MIEPMFGTAPSPWSGFSPSGIGWPIAAGGRSLTNGPAFSASPLPPVGGAVLPPDVVGGYSVPALLSVVAIRRGQPLGPTNDQEIEEFVYDALEMLPGTNEVEVRCDGGRITLTGSVPHKRVKRDVGEIAWGIPIVNDVQNNLTIATKRRARPTQREGEPPQGQSSRKQG